MKYSHVENDKILDAWNEFSIKNGEGQIERDGVAYKGVVHSFQNEKGDMVYERQPGNEETVWNNSVKRILFVLKELNDSNPYDSRVVVTYDPDNGKIPSNRNIKNMLYVTKGILESRVDKASPFNENDDMNILMKMWDSAAVAKINVKKQPGDSVADTNEIADHMNTYKEFLKQQLQLLDANIIVCCDNRAGILSAIKELVYPHAIQLTNEVWYDKSSGAMLIESYHTSARISYKSFYDRVINNFVDALARFNENTLNL